MKNVFVVVVTILVITFISKMADATNIRGYIETNTKTGITYPYAGAKVDLYALRNGVWIVLASTYTDNKGIYYMYNITPGTYSLQVNGKFNYNITVDPAEFQDLPFITL